jgi:putative transcriptional regulator
MPIIIKFAGLLEKHNLSHRKFAKITGIRHPTISAMCNNEVKQIPLENLDTICKYFDCSIQDILEYKK